VSPKLYRRNKRLREGDANQTSVATSCESDWISTKNPQRQLTSDRWHQFNETTCKKIKLICDF